MVSGIIFLVFIVAVLIHSCFIGTYYIEFDGDTYWVWQRAFMGYSNCRGMFRSEDDAQKCIERLRGNPPKIISPR